MLEIIKCIEAINEQLLKVELNDEISEDTRVVAVGALTVVKKQLFDELDAQINEINVGA